MRSLMETSNAIAEWVQGRNPGADSAMLLVHYHCSLRIGHCAVQRAWSQCLFETVWLAGIGGKTIQQALEITEVNYKAHMAALEATA